MEGFQGVTERFHVRLVSDSEGSEPVVCQVSLDGLFLLSPDGHRTKRKFPLNHISRWALRGSSLILYTRTPVDVEERTVTLQGDDRVIRSVLDTLTCCCMQCAIPPLLVFRKSLFGLLAMVRAVGLQECVVQYRPVSCHFANSTLSTKRMCQPHPSVLLGWWSCFRRRTSQRRTTARLPSPFQQR